MSRTTVAGDTDRMMGEIPQSMPREIGADCHIRSVDHSNHDATDIPKHRMACGAMDRPRGHDGEPDRTSAIKIKGKSRLVDPAIERRLMALIPDGSSALNIRRDGTAVESLTGQSPGRHQDNALPAQPRLSAQA